MTLDAGAAHEAVRRLGEELGLGTAELAEGICDVANAIAVVDLNRARVSEILPLGAKDHGIAGSGLDPSDRDGGIGIESFAGLKGLVLDNFRQDPAMMKESLSMALFARNYIKVPPSTVAIFYGRKHTLVDDKGCKAWSQRFGDKWEAKDKKCTWSADGGKDVLTLGDGDWARKVTADGDYLVSDQFTETVKYTTKAASFDEAKLEAFVGKGVNDFGTMLTAALASTGSRTSCGCRRWPLPVEASCMTPCGSATSPELPTPPSSTTCFEPPTPSAS